MLQAGGQTLGGKHMNLRGFALCAAAPPLPSVATGAAVAITDTSATLAGTVNPSGSFSAYVFEYGPTLSFGSITTPAGAGSGGAAAPVGATLTSLAPNTTYYYRLVAQKRGRHVDGAGGFRTTGPPQPPIAITGAATDVTSTAATLAGQVNPRGLQTATTFELGTSTSFGAITAVVALDDADALEPVSARLTGLTPNTTYLYRAVATNATGTAVGTDAASSTTAAD